MSFGIQRWHFPATHPLAVMRYIFANLLLFFLPPTRFFSLKRILLRACGIVIGQGTRICGGTKFYGAGRVVIGRDCWIGIETKFHTAANAEIRIGDHCDIAPEVMFICGSHKIGCEGRRAGAGTAKSIQVGHGTWIGVRSTVLAGAQLHGSSICAAGSLVLGNSYPEHSLLAGHPVKVIRLLDIKGQK